MEVFRALQLNSRDDVARFYLLIVCPMLLALNFVFVPFHAPDDYDHVKRAYTLAHGSLWPVTQTGEASGGYIDASLAQMIEAQKRIIFQWPRVGSILPPGSGGPVSSEKQELRWSGASVYSEFPGSASLLPLVYVPQAVALWLGEGLGLSVEKSVFAARLLNGVTAVLIIAAALTVLPFGAGSILLILLLPKTLVQFASNSADPILHALTLAIIAFTSKALSEGWVPRTTHFLLVSLAMLVLAGTRPPMAVLTLLPLWVAWRQRNVVAVVALVAAIAIAVVWFAAIIPQITDPRCGPTGTLESKALAFMTHGPILVARSLWWHKLYYYVSFVGELGWGNGPHGRVDGLLPIWTYVAAAVIIPFAAAYDMAHHSRPCLSYRILLLFCGFGITATIFFVMYLGCTDPTSTVIGGVQGRYFVAPAVLITSALAGLTRPMAVLGKLYLPLLLLFTLLNFATLMSEGLRIYWLSQ